MFDILDDITKGQGRPEDIDLLLELAEAVARGSLCALIYSYAERIKVGSQQLIAGARCSSGARNYAA